MGNMNKVVYAGLAGSKAAVRRAEAAARNAAREAIRAEGKACERSAYRDYRYAERNLRDVLNQYESELYWLD